MVLLCQAAWRLVKLGNGIVTHSLRGIGKVLSCHVLSSNGMTMWCAVSLGNGTVVLRVAKYRNIKA